MVGPELDRELVDRANLDLARPGRGGRGLVLPHHFRPDPPERFKRAIRAADHRWVEVGTRTVPPPFHMTTMSDLPVSPLLPPGRYVDLPGRGRTFIREVEGPPGAPTLVLLHGWTATADLNWHPFFSSLGEHYRVIAPDHRGHGRGIRQAGRFTLEDCADDVAALCDVLDIESVIPVGYSMGGPVAQLVWRRHPTLVDALVLCATSATFSEGWRDSAVFGLLGGLSVAGRKLPPHVQRKIGMRLLSAKDRDPAQWVVDELATHDWARVGEAGMAIGRFNSERWLHNIDVPTSVILTLRDDVVEPVRQLRLARAIPGAELHMVEGDHAVCAVEPDVFGPVLLSACHHVERRARARAAIVPRATRPLRVINDHGAEIVADHERNSAAFSIWRAAASSAPA